MTPNSHYTIPGSLKVLSGIFLVTIALSSCSTSESAQEDVDLFALGETLCLEARWGDARNALRAFLVDNPNHPGAHFYLGRSYLFWDEDFRPVIAEGEIQTALQLFYENGRESYIERFTPAYFEFICNIESLKVCNQEFSYLVFADASKNRKLATARRSRKYLEAAKDIDPDSEDLLTGEEMVRRLERAARRAG